MIPRGLPPGLAGALADAVLVLHVAVVAFIVLGLVAIVLGAWRGWNWVRDIRWRVAHVALMGVVALQAWLGAACPLTVWEQALRAHAGEPTHSTSFIEHWLARLIFFEAPAWVFVAAYTVFAGLLLLAWKRVPPRRRSRGP